MIVPEVKEIVDVYHLCNSCNKEFKLEGEHYQNNNEAFFSFQDCPNCKKRNDIWLKIKVNKK